MKDIKNSIRLLLRYLKNAGVITQLEFKTIMYTIDTSKGEIQKEPTKILQKTSNDFVGMKLK